MERFVKGDIVVLPFPYTDFSVIKNRPASVIANLRGNNLILAQITTNEREDEDLVKLSGKDFSFGSLKKDSYIMASLIFTAEISKIKYIAGKIKTEKIKEIENKLIEVFTR